MRSGQTLAQWVRALATEQGLPITTVRDWPDALLMEAAAGYIVRRGVEDARALFKAKQEPAPDGSDLRAQVTRAVYARLVAADRAAKAKDNDDAFAALIEQGHFQ